MDRDIDDLYNDLSIVVASFALMFIFIIILVCMI